MPVILLSTAAALQQLPENLYISFLPLYHCKTDDKSIEDEDVNDIKKIYFHIP
jgi:hypothetical protein